MYTACSKELWLSKQAAVEAQGLAPVALPALHAANLSRSYQCTAAKTKCSSSFAACAKLGMNSFKLQANLSEASGWKLGVAVFWHVSARVEFKSFRFHLSMAARVSYKMV